MSHGFPTNQHKLGGRTVGEANFHPEHNKGSGLEVPTEQLLPLVVISNPTTTQPSASCAELQCPVRGGERGYADADPDRQAQDVGPQVFLADVLARINDHKITELAALLPWNWRSPLPVERAA
jgi:hypothetical protein